MSEKDLARERDEQAIRLGVAIVRGDIAQACMKFEQATTAAEKQDLLTVLAGGKDSKGVEHHGLRRSGYIADTYSPEEYARLTDHVETNWAPPRDNASRSQLQTAFFRETANRPQLDADFLRPVSALKSILINRSMSPLGSQGTHVPADSLIHPLEVVKLLTHYRQNVEATLQQEQQAAAPGANANRT